MNIKQRALLHTVLALVGATGLALIINIIIGMMTPDQLALAFAISVVLLFAKIIYDYRLNQLEYQEKLAEIAEKNTK